MTDPGDCPLAKVAVSNGESVVLTDGRGRYSLAADPCRHTHVFVTVPSGWQSVGPFHQPLADCPARDCDFVLRRRGRSARTVRFNVITDLHFGYPGTPANTARWFTAELGRIQQISNPQFTVAAGDLTETGRIDQLETLSKIFARLDKPIFPLFGNHDGSTELKNHRASPTPWPWFGNFLRTMGPAWYSFEWGPCHFSVMVNEEAYLTERARRAQRGWLLADVRLAQRRGLIPVVTAHAPPAPHVARELAGRGVRLFIHGHWHCLRHYRLGSMDIIGLPSTTFGGIDMFPRGCFAVQIAAGGSLNFKYVPLGPIRKPRPGKTKSKVIWRRKLADYFHFNAPALADGRLLAVANRDTTGQGSSLLCLSPDTDRTVWQRPLPAAVKHTPVLWQDRIYLTTQGGEVICLSQKAGRLLWARRLADHPHRWINSAPAIADDSVLVAGTLSGGLAGFDVHSGKRLWSVDPPQSGGPTFLRDTWPWQVGPRALGSTVLIPRHGAGLSCLDAHTGRVKWQYDYKYAYYLPGPLSFGKAVWCPSPQPAAHNVLLDAATGRVVRTCKFNGVPICWAVDRDRLYVTVLDKWVGGRAYLQSRSAKTGRLFWQRPLPRDPADAYHYLRNGPACLAPPVIYENVIYQSCTDGTIRLFDAVDGKQLGRLDLSSPLFSPPVIGPRRLWLTTWSGSLCCLQRRSRA